MQFQTVVNSQHSNISHSFVFVTAPLFFKYFFFCCELFSVESIIFPKLCSGRAAVALEVELVAHLLEGRWFNLWLLQSAYPCVLEEETEPQIAPDGFSISMCECVCLFLINMLALGR